ncbi:MAG TPA: hypothetical protein VMV47_11240 [Bacteroidales bacterium]|nr:hypothetical protein [Bacteroidales bacterium]
MGLTSTHYLTYRDINVKDADLIEDAFGFERDFNDVIFLLRKFRVEPGATITRRLIEKIKNRNQ